jgi:hypothetical protein
MSASRLKDAVMFPTGKPRSLAVLTLRPYASWDQLSRSFTSGAAGTSVPGASPAAACTSSTDMSTGTIAGIVPSLRAGLASVPAGTVPPGRVTALVS